MYTVCPIKTCVALSQHNNDYLLGETEYIITEQ